MLNPGVARLAEQNMRVAAKAEEIRDALRRDDAAACALFDRLRTENPELAQQVADALKGGARS